MSTPRTPKKSESLEIRIPYPTKQAFMARCRDEGRSASEAVRAFIEGHLDGTPTERPVRATRKRLRLVAGALIAAAMGAVALPSLARSSAGPAFERLDANGDGRISATEFAQAFRRLDANHDGMVSADEYRRGLGR